METTVWDTNSMLSKEVSQGYKSPEKVSQDYKPPEEVFQDPWILPGCLFLNYLLWQGKPDQELIDVPMSMSWSIPKIDKPS